ncbi:aldehyde dehydrogenase family protein [Burkholderia stabilis]|uniref:Aldehyde dehydrogenase family protein n=1 Tax=Burkholderia stabilis TaxID=95485 RepID=A0A4Q2AE20_9BURK|nr:aldehyde dehydrogenase family protein [Burkholderia stabilis]
METNGSLPFAIHQRIPRIAAGTAWVNCHSLLDDAMPFGLMKRSGFGRELGRAVIYEYTESEANLISLRFKALVY